MLGLLPSGVLIASGCTLYLYTRFNYGPQAPAFENFTKLRQHLVSSTSLKQRGYVIIEGTVRKVTKDDDNEGDLKTTKLGETSTISDISVPFLLIDREGESITITAVKSPLNIKLTVEKTQKEALEKQNNDQTSQSLLPLTEAQLGVYGFASMEDNQIVICPSEVDVSLSAIVARQKSRRRKLYAGSGFLVLSGGALFVIGVVLPVFRVYKLLRTLLALIGI